MMRPDRFDFERAENQLPVIVVETVDAPRGVGRGQPGDERGDVLTRVPIEQLDEILPRTRGVFFGAMVGVEVGGMIHL